MDMPENKRTERVKELEAAYDNVVDSIYGVASAVPEEDMSDTEVAFMKAAQRGQARILPPIMPGEDTIENLPE